MKPPEPTPLRKPLDGFASTVMLALCICWGLQQVALKGAAPYMSPVLQVGLRSFFAAILVAGVMLVRGESLSFRDGTFWPGLLAGFLFAGEFLLVSLGLNYTTAGHMAVFLYTAPVFTALGMHVWFWEERMKPRRWAGVGLAFAGIALAFSGSFFAPGGKNRLLGDALGILAGVFWAATTISIRATRLADARPTRTLLYQLAVASLLLLPFAWWNGLLGAVKPSPVLWMCLVFQSVVVAFASFLTWFWLLRKYLASRLSSFSFLTPLFAVVFGILFLREPLDPRFAFGAIFVLAGVTIVNRK